jgi:tetratricopeptide (TPR) repeat protein
MRSSRFFILLASILLPVSGVLSQTISETFIELTHNLTANTPHTYKELDEALRPYRQDTVMMKYFAIHAVQNNYMDGISYAYNQLGSRNRELFNFQRSLEYHEKALTAAIDADNAELRILSLNMLGLVHLRRDAIKLALDYNQDALNLARSVINPSYVVKQSVNTSLQSIGTIYMALEQYDLAIDRFKESARLDEELGNTAGLATSYAKIGECQEALGLLDESLDYYQRAQALNEMANSDEIMVRTNFGIAHVYVHQERMEEARAIFESILPLSKELGDLEVISAIYINLGWTFLHLNQHAKAESYILLGLNISENNNLINNIYTANTFLHDLYEKKGDFEKAHEYYKTAQEVRKEISNDRNRQYVHDVISRSNADRRINQIEVLARENELVKLRLRRNQNTLLVSALLLALFSLILYILYRQYQLKSDKKLLTLEQSMLRSQMNPHFLFNSLNSIKLYIINNEKKNAVHYLNKFSKLVRKILEASSVKEIALEEELETVELYMNIENIRFNHEIDFEITIDKGIDTHLVKIPSLILQPFLENALWHGLSSKKGEKRIDLHVSRTNAQFINISISDNGVGREEAEKLKESKVLKRKSVGIDITRERLANFSKDYQNSFEVEIIDLFDGESNPAGTQIMLHIPTI